MDSLTQAMFVSASGMRAQALRLRTISQNLANHESTTLSPNIDPYRRKTIHFDNIFDRNVGTETLRVSAIREDPRRFELRYLPDHPASDERGYVKLPNVNKFIETADFKQALRSYRTNMNTFALTRSMFSRTVSLVR